MNPPLRRPSLAELDLVLASLATLHGVDLRRHRRETLARRMSLRFAAAGCPDGGSYVARLEADPLEAARLVSTLLIGVTAFFRDKPVFDALAERVVPSLVTRAAPRGIVRAWTAGVAGGEEAYSLATILVPACRSAGVACEIVATDLDRLALERAAAGWYPQPAVEAVPERVRERFFHRQAEGWRVADELRRHVRFVFDDIGGPRRAPTEAVVASFDLVLVRNVLIYLQPPAQELALVRVTSALEPRGVLVLGSAERPAGAAGIELEAFPGLDPALRIYERKGRPR